MPSTRKPKSIQRPVTIQATPTTRSHAAQEQDLLAGILGTLATVQITTHSVVRNQIRFRRGERIAPPLPSCPNPQEAALNYQMRDLKDLLDMLTLLVDHTATLQELLGRELLALKKHNR